MKLFKYFCLLSFMASCSSEQTPQELLSVDLRSGMDHPSMLALQDEIESVEYIPLETTADPASLLDGVYNPQNHPNKFSKRSGLMFSRKLKRSGLF